jgi:TolB protein
VAVGPSDNGTTTSAAADATDTAPGDAADGDQPDAGAPGGDSPDGDSTGGDGTDGDSTDGDSAGGDGTDGDGTDDADGVGPGGGDAIEDPAGAPAASAAEVAERLADIGGNLAVGNGPEVAVVRPDGEGGVLLDGGAGTVAAQATWSHDGAQLAWVSISPRGQAVTVQPFGDDGRPDEERRFSRADGLPIFYLQWNAADDRLASLSNAREGVGVELGVLQPGRAVRTFFTGLPHFVAWAPTGDRLLSHADNATMVLHDPVSPRRSATVAELVGGFTAPGWIDGQVALVVADGELNRLDVGTGSLTPILDLAGPARFVVSPDGSKVAFQRGAGPADDGPLTASLSRPGQAPPVRTAVQTPPALGDGALVVLDLATGDQEIVTNEEAVAWEWSPNSSHLAWLSVEVDLWPRGRWHFWSTETDELPVTETPEFVLSRIYRQAYLPFFAQYGQSVTGWSPDSTAFAFAGIVEQQRGIWIQLTDRPAELYRVAETGDVVTWGPGETLPLEAQGPSAA